jgi:hypothetical protein
MCATFVVRSEYRLHGASFLEVWSDRLTMSAKHGWSQPEGKSEK